MKTTRSEANAIAKAMGWGGDDYSDGVVNTVMAALAIARGQHTVESVRTATFGDADIGSNDVARRYVMTNDNSAKFDVLTGLDDVKEEILRQADYAGDEPDEYADCICIYEIAREVGLTVTKEINVTFS